MKLSELPFRNCSSKEQLAAKPGPFFGATEEPAAAGRAVEKSSTQEHGCKH